MSRPTDAQLKALGASMREIDPSSLQSDEEGSKVRWFLGENATELFAWIKPGASPHHLQLVFARVSTEWDLGSGLSTGTFATGSTTAGGRYDPYLLTIGTTIDEEVCRAALVLLRSMKVEASVTSPMVGALEAVLRASQATG